MANSVSAPYYGPYPTNMQAGYSTSPTGTLGVPGSIPGSGPAYSSYDNTKQFSGAAMLAASFASPTAPQYSAAAAYYSQPNTSITYGQHTTSGIYSNYNNQSQLQANTSLTAAHAQLAAASLRGFQSPPYGTTSFSSLQHTGAASVQPSFDQTLYNKMYSEQIAAAQVQAAQQQAQQQQAQQQQALQQAHQQQQQQQAEVQQVQAQLSSGFQQKHDIVDGYIQASGANRLQASIIPQPTQHHLLSSKQQLSAHITPTSPSPDHRSSYPNLDSLQSSFSCPPPVVPPPTSLPPKPTPHMPPTNKMSSLSMRENRNKHSDVSPGSQHMFKRSVVTCKIPFQKTIHMHNHLCETCKVSCASSKTYKDHIEGQRHKKRVALREQEKKNEEQAAAPPTGPSYKCVLCDVTCTGKETFDAHITGMKHKKAAKLYKELGKEIPPHEITGDTEPKPEVPVVGRELIETKSDASKSSKVIYHCKMCECTFNDDLAKELHLKGRRHRLNYKKNYDPSLKVEIQPSKREKIAEQKARRRAEEAERRRNMVESRRHIWEQSRWRAEEEWHEWAEARSWHQYESLKQKQAADYEERVTKEKEHCKKMGLPEPTLPPRPHIPPPPPRQNNARFICPGIDEFLMIQKQSMVSPKEEHLDTLQDLVSGVEMALRQVSDNLYSETKEQMSAQGITPTITARIIRTIHKTGDLTKAILLHENLTTDVAVLCTEKPTQSILTTVYSKFKDLFQCPEEGKVELRADKSMFVVTQGDGAPDFVVNVKLTSPAFDAPVSEDERRAEFVAKVLERKFCEIAMSDVNEAGWYKSRFKPNTPAVIVLRILASLRLEPDSELKDLSIQALQMLVFIAFKTFGHIKTVAPTLILRRFFELLAAGYILTEELIPHWHQAKTPTKNLLENLEMQQREKITEYAQYALRCIALGQLHKVLLIPPPPNPPAFPSPIPSARS